MPLSILISSASYNKGDMALSLIAKFKNTYGSTFKSVNYIMDSGYDYKKVYAYITHIIKAQAIIALNTREAYAPPEGINENSRTICSLGY